MRPAQRDAQYLLDVLNVCRIIKPEVAQLSGK